MKPAKSFTSKFAASVKVFPILKTECLILRQVREEGAEHYFDQLSSLPPTSSWLDGLEAQSVENARNSIRSYNNYFQRAKTIIPWALADENDALIGFIKLFDIAYRSKGEIGYWVAKPYWGRGLATEAVGRVVRFAFTELGMHRIYATTHPDNLASQRVLEKIGFQKEGALRKHGRRQGKWTDSVMFGLLSTDEQPTSNDTPRVHA